MPQPRVAPSLLLIDEVQEATPKPVLALLMAQHEKVVKVRLIDVVTKVGIRAPVARVT